MKSGVFSTTRVFSTTGKQDLNRFLTPFPTTRFDKKKIRVERFELSTSSPPDLHANQAALHPDDDI